MLHGAYRRGSYDRLYENYLQPSCFDEHVLELARTLDPHRGDFAADLCSGTGHTAIQLARQGLFVAAVDKHKSMLQQLLKKVAADPLVQQVFQPPLQSVWAIQADINQPRWADNVKSMLWTHGPDSGLRLMTCRQGIGYLTPEALYALPRLLDEGGVFTFNAFAQPRRLRFSRYTCSDGSDIREVGAFLFGRVIHLQVRGWKADLTIFRWHDIDAISQKWKNDGFGVSRRWYGRTEVVTVWRP